MGGNLRHICQLNNRVEALVLSLLHTRRLGTHCHLSPSSDKFPRLNLAIPTHEEAGLEEELTAGWEIPDAGKDLPGSGWPDDQGSACLGACLLLLLDSAFVFFWAMPFVMLRQDLQLMPMELWTILSRTTHPRNPDFRGADQLADDVRATCARLLFTKLDILNSEIVSEIE
ncbi:hypothetical protein KI387_007495, partial [Taxus chinensis]